MESADSVSTRGDIRAGYHSYRLHGCKSAGSLTLLGMGRGQIFWMMLPLHRGLTLLRPTVIRHFEHAYVSCTDHTGDLVVQPC